MSPKPPACHSRREEVVSRQLKGITITKAPQYGPCGLVPATLDEECVQEEEACARTEEGWHPTPTSPLPTQQAQAGNPGSPSRVSRSSLTPPATFLHTTLFTSSRACGARGWPKQDFCLREEVALDQPAAPHCQVSSLRAVGARQWVLGGEAHLKGIELLVAERVVQVLIREPEDACEGLGARGPQLQGWQLSTRRPLSYSHRSPHSPILHASTGRSKCAALTTAHLFGLGVIEGSCGVQNSLLSIVKQL